MRAKEEGGNKGPRGDNVSIPFPPSSHLLCVLLVWPGRRHAVVHGAQLRRQGVGQRPARVPGETIKKGARARGRIYVVFPSTSGTGIAGSLGLHRPQREKQSRQEKKPGKLRKQKHRNPPGARSQSPVVIPSSPRLVVRGTRRDKDASHPRAL